jgi:hypothetical protein
MGCRTGLNVAEERKIPVLARDQTLISQPVTILTELCWLTFLSEYQCALFGATLQDYTSSHTWFEFFIYQAPNI